jgi:hypothetical protein
MGDHCHWLHRKRNLRYTPRNSPPQFLCLELLRLSSLRLTAPPTPTLSGVFAFHHRRSPFITGFCTPSIRWFCNSSSFHPCMHWKGPRLLPLSRAHETSCCTTSYTLSLLWASSGNSSSPCTCCLITVTCWILRVLLHNLRVPSCNFCSPDFPLFLAYVWQQLILSQHLSKSK